MPEEIGSTIENLRNVSIQENGDLKIFTGEWHNCDAKCNPFLISVAWSGWGKVSAARAATRILSLSLKESSIDLLLFTGVAGSANKKIKQWDILIPTELMQHDMDARPLFPKYVIPVINKAKIKPNNSWTKWAYSSITEAIDNNELDNFGKVETGLIATGDKFINDKSVLEHLSKELPNLVGVEMEGAAVAQVAFQEKIPCLIIRVISDSADSEAAQTFHDFLKDYQKHSWDLIHSLLKRFLNSPTVENN